MFKDLHCNENWNVQSNAGTYGTVYIQQVHLILAAMASWLTREQAEVIKYLREENRVFRDKVPGKRISCFGSGGRRRDWVLFQSCGR